MSSLSKFGIGMVGICMICTSACRSSNWQSANSVATLQAERRAKVEKSIGLKQSDAELHVAKDAWTFGDRTACLAAVDGILEREPGHVEALLLKAEVHLAKDELIDADRAIAIALSHDPKNSTAKRLSEIAQTKQLAGRPHEPVRQPMDVTPAPLPGGAVAQAEYSPSDAGSVFVDDTGSHTAEAPSLDANAEAGIDTTEGPGYFQAFAPLHNQLLEGLIPESDIPPMMAAAAEPIEPLEQPIPVSVAHVESQTPPGPLSEEKQIESLGPPAPVSTELPSLQAMAPLTEHESLEPVGLPGPVSVAAAIQPIPAPLQAAQAVAFESCDDSAGTAEVTDQSASADSLPVQSDFLSAIASSDSMAALAAVETDLTDNPNDPQIPISATVAALEANQPETAASIARLGIAFHPSCAGLHRTLGAALYRTGNYASSQVALQQALSLDNSSALSYFLMGCVSEKLGDAEAAESHFARATELDPTIAEGE
jgi:tetratricopeptide (TPR) repeat protein